MKTKVEKFLEAQLNRTLKHEYDPVAAREYYLRTRELKGRTKGSDPTLVSVQNAAKSSAAAEAAQKEISTERKSAREELKSKLEELEVRVERLKLEIKKAKVAAMRRAGGVSEETLSRMITKELKSPGSSKKPDDKDSKDAKGSEAESDSSDDKPKTAAEKKKAAKAAKEKYEEENPESGDEGLQNKIDEAAKRIETLQKRLEAIARIGT